MKKAVDAEGKDSVIVSHVKGHSNEIHIGIGQATWKEAETNNEVDKRAVQVAQKHTIPKCFTDFVFEPSAEWAYK